MNYKSPTYLQRILQYCYPFLMFLLFAVPISLRAQKFEWATCGAGSFSQAYSVATDPNGNVYTVGYFGGTVDFDPGPGIYNLTSSMEDIFVQKLDASGKFVWAYRFGGTHYDIGRFVTTDSFGYVYVTGYFQDTADFDPGAAVHNLSSNGGDDVFILKLDTAGNFVWAGNIGGSNDDESGAITIDHSGNMYINGGFKGTADFDPGPGTYNMTATSGMSMFILKLNSSGDFVFAKSIDGSLAAGINGGSCTSIALDWKNDIYSSGDFTGTFDFNPGSDTSYMMAGSDLNAFILKLDSTGNFIWAKQISGVPTGDSYASMALDKTGSAYLSGFFSNTIDLDPGAGTYLITNASTIPEFNTYIAKLDPSGHFVWGKQLAAAITIQNTGTCLDRSGSVYCSGVFEGSVDFDPGPGTFYMTAPSGSSYDSYVERLDSNGNFQDAFKIDGTNTSDISSIAVDRKKNVYIAGDIQGTFDFDPGPGTFTLSSPSPTVAATFTAKYNRTKYGSYATTGCGSYSSGGHTWTTSGTYPDTLIASDGPDSIVSLTLTIIPSPSAGSITGVDTVCAGSHVTLTATVPGGTWSMSSTSLATVTGGIVSGIAPGPDTVLYTVTDGVTGCSGFVAHPVFIKTCTGAGIADPGAAPEYIISPNPNNGNFSLSYSSTRCDGAELIITSIAGQQVQRFTIKNNMQYSLSPDLPQGIYLLHINCDDGKRMQKIVVIR